MNYRCFSCCFAFLHFKYRHVRSNEPVEIGPKNDIGLFINRSLSDIEKNIVSAFVTDKFNHILISNFLFMKIK